MHIVQSLVDALRDNVVLLGLLVGAVTPLLTSVIQQPRLGKRGRTIVAGVVSVVVGFATAAADGQLDNLGSVAAVIAAVAVSAEATYQKLWKETGVAGAVESVTNVVAEESVYQPRHSDEAVVEEDEDPGVLETK